jgi:hypothetical protein
MVFDSAVIYFDVQKIHINVMEVRNIIKETF